MQLRNLLLLHPSTPPLRTIMLTAVQRVLQTSPRSHVVLRLVMVPFDRRYCLYCQWYNPREREHRLDTSPFSLVKCMVKAREQITNTPWHAIRLSVSESAIVRPEKALVLCLFVPKIGLGDAYASSMMISHCSFLLRIAKISATLNT